MKRYRSFTLVETMVVVVIFSIIGLCINLSLSSGIKLWLRAQNSGFLQCELFFRLEAIARELRNSVNIWTIGYEGNSGEVSFPVLINHSIFKVTYKFKPEDKALMRGQASLRDILDEAEKDGYFEKKALEAEELSFSYFGFDSEQKKYIWADTWLKAKGPFTAIRIQGRFKDEEFIKTVFVPIA